jgi:hypothetical protein
MTGEKCTPQAAVDSNADIGLTCADARLHSVQGLGFSRRLLEVADLKADQGWGNH